MSRQAHHTCRKYLKGNANANPGLLIQCRLYIGTYCVKVAIGYI